MWSLSARRAWIEIGIYLYYIRYPMVALRKESVDRNFFIATTPNGNFVALRKESVDRNIDQMKARGYGVGRSPQGERG